MLNLTQYEDEKLISFNLQYYLIMDTLCTVVLMLNENHVTLQCVKVAHCSVTTQQ